MLRTKQRLSFSFVPVGLAREDRVQGVEATGWSSISTLTRSGWWMGSTLFCPNFAEYSSIGSSGKLKESISHWNSKLFPFTGMDFQIIQVFFKLTRFLYFSSLLNITSEPHIRHTSLTLVLQRNGSDAAISNTCEYLSHGLNSKIDKKCITNLICRENF